MLFVHLLAMHTLICVPFSLPPGVGGWLRLLLVALPGLFCLPFSILAMPSRLIYPSNLTLVTECITPWIVDI